MDYGYEVASYARPECEKAVLTNKCRTELLSIPWANPMQGISAGLRLT